MVNDRLRLETGGFCGVKPPFPGALLGVGGVELRRGHREGGIELGAQSRHRGHDGDGDEGGDQAVFDSGGAGLVADEGLQGVVMANSLLAAPGSVAIYAEG